VPKRMADVDGIVARGDVLIPLGGEVWNPDA